jgi:hypothetical protein
VFTARCALSPYIKQTSFVFKGLTHTNKSIMSMSSGVLISSSFSVGLHINTAMVIQRLFEYHNRNRGIKTANIPDRHDSVGTSSVLLPTFSVYKSSVCNQCDRINSSLIIVEIRNTLYKLNSLSGMHSSRNSIRMQGITLQVMCNIQICFRLCFLGVHKNHKCVMSLQIHGFE